MQDTITTSSLTKVSIYFRLHGLSRTLTIAVLKVLLRKNLDWLSLPACCYLLPCCCPLCTLYSLLLICSSYPTALQIYVLFLCYSLLPAQISYARRVIFPQLRCTLRVFLSDKDSFLSERNSSQLNLTLTLYIFHATQS